MFLTANEAYNMSKYNVKDIIEQELYDVLDKIIQATEKGKFEITCEYLTKENKKQLKELGYKVKVKDSYYGKYYNISWNKRKFFK